MSAKEELLEFVNSLTQEEVLTGGVFLELEFDLY